MRIAVLLAAAAGCVLGRAADWPLERGNPQQTGSQRHETVLTAASVRGLQLLWKYQVSAAGSMTLATPTMLGRLITHRGIKELVFVVSNSGRLVALDADLGTVFWERHLSTVVPAQRSCTGYPMPSPVITPAPPSPAGIPADDEGADRTQGNRPLYILSADGKVHTISPITGLDISGPIDFLPSDLSVSSLNFFANTLYAVTARTCENTRSKVWAVQVQGHEPVASWPAGAITIGDDGTVYLTIAGDVLQTRSLKLQELYTPLKDKVADATPVFFTWGGLELIAASSQAGGTLLLDAEGMGAKPQHEPIVRSEPLTNDSGAPQLTSLASWESPEGVRWVYAANGRIRAFKMEEKDHAPVLKPTWESKGFYNSATPVIANGVVYTLAGTRSPEQHEARSTLYALDATTGQRLYSSGETVPADAHSGLAVANGHVCFGGSNETIYCFGLPFEP